MILLEKEIKELLAEMDRTVNKLAELGCSSVALFATFPMKDGYTGSRASRRGNYFAQKGHIQEWLDNQKQSEQARFIAEAVEDLDGDGDEGV